MTPTLASARAPGRVAMAFFAFRGVVLPLLFLLLGSFLPRSQTFWQGVNAFEGLLTFVGVVFFWVWLHRVTSVVRATEGSKFSPGMAVGGWFIPFANLVLPALSMGDVFNKVTKRQFSWMPAVWWVSYMLATVLNGIRNVPQLSGAVFTVPGMPWVLRLLTMGAFGLWAAMIFLVSEKPSTETVSSSSVQSY